MSLVKSALSILGAGAAAFVLSTTAFAATSTTATASPSATPTPTPAAGPLTIALTCDTGAGGSGTFSVTANGHASTLTVKCGKSATVSSAAWKAGSTATIHQTAATASGQLRAPDVKVTLKAAGETVAIRNFRAAAAVSATTATLAQTGGGLPVLPIGAGLLGLLMVAFGIRRLVAQPAR